MITKINVLEDNKAWWNASGATKYDCKDNCFVKRANRFVGKDPKIFKETIASTNANFWKETINEEMDIILSSITLVLVDLPLASKFIGCKQVFWRKYNIDGSIQIFKTKLITKGFR